MLLEGPYKMGLFLKDFEINLIESLNERHGRY